MAELFGVWRRATREGRRGNRGREVELRRHPARSFEVLEARVVMDGAPFGGGGGGPYQEPGELDNLSSAQILQLLVDLDLTTKNSVAELVQTLDFDSVFTSMTNVEVLTQLLRLDLVKDYADIDDLVQALPAADVDLSILRPDGVLTAVTTARGGSLLTVSATTAKQSFESLFVAAPLTFLNIFDARPLLELFDDRIVSTAGAAVERIYAIPFFPTQDGMDSILDAYVLDVDLDHAGNEIEPLIPRAISELNAMPAGHRALLSHWIGFEGYGTDDGGVTTGMIDPVDSHGNPAEFFTIWSDLWQQQLYAKYDDWVGRFKDAGGQLDVVVVDIETKSYSFWSLSQARSRFSTPTGQTVWQTIKADPRWGAVEAELRAYGMTTAQLNNISTWISTGPEAQIWNAVMERRRADYINNGIYEALRKHFPDVRFSNYGNYYHSQTQPSGLYNKFTGTWASIGAVVGTTQSQELFLFPRSITTPTTSYDSAPPSQASVQSIQGINGVVTVNTYRDITGLRPGDTVRIYEQIPRGIEDYVGLFTVHQVLGSHKFTYLDPGNNLPLVNLPNATATGYAEFFNSWNAMVHDMKYVRTQVASSNLPLHPWIPAPQWSEQIRGLPYTYWTEQILHVGLHDVDEIIFWNSALAGMDPAGEGNALMDQVLAELQPLIGYADRRSLTTTEADWYDGYLLTGMEAHGKRIWRLTPDPKLTVSIARGVNTTFTIGGKQVTIPHSTIYTPRNPVSTKGYWVIQTAGTTELTGTVDQVLDLLTGAAGIEAEGRDSGPKSGFGLGDTDSELSFDRATAATTGKGWMEGVPSATTVSSLAQVWVSPVDWIEPQWGDKSGDDGEYAGFALTRSGGRRSVASKATGPIEADFDEALRHLAETVALLDADAIVIGR